MKKAPYGDLQRKIALVSKTLQTVTFFMNILMTSPEKLLVEIVG